MENPFHPEDWEAVDDFAFTDITYHRARRVPAVRIAFDRPEVRNAFRPHTVDELLLAFDHARQAADVACVLLTGNGPSPKDGGWAFCSGGDQRIRGQAGYQYEAAGPAGTAGLPTGQAGMVGQLDGSPGQPVGSAGTVDQAAALSGAVGQPGGPASQSVIDQARLGRLHILEVQRLIRFMPKPVIALVNGWAAGGGHSLHVICDLTLASREQAQFKQTDADVGSFDAGYGSAYLARQVGQKMAREIFFLGQTYDAEQAYEMGAVNSVVPHAELETVGLRWASLIAEKSPTAIRLLKYAFNAIDDGLVGQQLFAGETTRLAYMTDEAQEGRDSFLEKRPPDWSDYPYYY
ncbi:MAG: 1,4-dihydroxy-2-naphthoyl-CoA synthase [Propionibacteriaceae bacterium]|jgi:naphthoate synthase|nr:1,4-dihydroxy-2-naphthoyl-CoA synthase [Propionibacteriaceae bacterium]